MCVPPSQRFTFHVCNCSLDTLPTASEDGPDVRLEPMLEWLSVIVVLFLLTGVVAAVCAIGAYIWHKGRKRKTGMLQAFHSISMLAN